jgi:hypothetical protein
MTKGYPAEEAPAASLPALRVERAEGTPLHHTQAGRIAVPLTLMRGTQRVEDLPLVLPAEQMEAFYKEIGAILYPSRVADPASATKAAS